MRLSRFQRCGLPVLLAWIALAAPSQAPQRIPEYEAKATILRAVGNYTRWPEDQTASPSRPFTIGILGHSPFGRHLEDQIRDQQVRGRKIRLLPLRTLNTSQIGTCDLLFICESEADRLAEVLDICRNRPILTVGDTPRFSQRKVMLNFTFEANHLGLEVNLKAVKDAGLEVGSSFLAISKARIVEPS